MPETTTAPAADVRPDDLLLIDDHNGGYWTTGADWGAWYAKNAGKHIITMGVVAVRRADNPPAVLGDIHDYATETGQTVADLYEVAGLAR